MICFREKPNIEHCFGSRDTWAIFNVQHIVNKSTEAKFNIYTWVIPVMLPLWMEFDLHDFEHPVSMPGLSEKILMKTCQLLNLWIKRTGNRDLLMLVEKYTELLFYITTIRKGKIRVEISLVSLTKHLPTSWDILILHGWCRVNTSKMKHDNFSSSIMLWGKKSEAQN